MKSALSSAMLFALLAGAAVAEADEVNVAGTVRVTPEGVFIETDPTQPPSADLGAPSANAAGRNFVAADFEGASLSGQSFVQANFIGVDFAHADLSNADFSRANFHNVDFEGANLRDACFLNATFINTDFADADLTGAVMTGTTQINVDLDSANLSGVVRDGPGHCPGQQ